MHRRVATAFGVAALGALAGAMGLSPSGASPPPGAESCPIFPADNVWHADVSALPTHPRSDAWLASMGGPFRRLHPDFGPSGDPLPYGIPYDVVAGSTPKVGVAFDYDDESDPGPYPFGPGTTIEGGSDRHALVIDRDACVLYELYAADWNGGAPTAGSGAVFDLRSNALRPSTWTSADAAGLPIFPGLLRLDEVQAGQVDHAIRITAQRTDRSYLWPARHQAGSASDPNLPPMGAWFRMRADFDIAGYRPETRVILTAFKTHGMVVADNGSNWYFTGSADDGWDEAVLNELKSVPAGAFEAVDTSALMVSSDSGQAHLVSGPPPAPPPPAPAPAEPTPVPPAAPAGSTAEANSIATPPAPPTSTSTTPAASLSSTTGLPPAIPAAGTASVPVGDAGADDSSRVGAAAAAAIAGAGGATWLGVYRRKRRRQASRPI